MKLKLSFKKALSLLLASLMIVQCSPFVMSVVSAANSAQATGSAPFGEAELTYKQELRMGTNGTFILKLTLDAKSEVSDQNENSLISRNGYFTAPADGRYLVQLWGGNGGNGVKGDGDGEAGIGGAGGYVYGIVELKKGETLFYQLGGAGQPTSSTGNGGGVNGNGGSAGSMSSNTVGGGGGYSAVYRFGVGEFESGYFTTDGEYGGNGVTEADRLSKHLMIAGGGGGGGAASGGGLFSDEGYAPNGGAGGSMSSAVISVDGNTIFAGSNGSSSSNTTRYVGQGGTDVPGEYSQTWVGWVESIQANNWAGTVNSSLAGGAGGGCNLRGGAGGAGYTGGGGGIQASLIMPTDVGGGGGGSSYLRSDVDYGSVDSSDLQERQTGSGGAIYIQRLDADTSYLSSVDLDIEPSLYFDVSADVSLVGLDLSGAEQIITLTFTPKADFAGGNAVPLLEGDFLVAQGGGKEVKIYLNPDCAAVNVPLNFRVNITTQVYDLTQDDLVAPTVDGMYTDDYASVRNDLGAYWQYDFIDSISEYTVIDPETGNDITGVDVITPDATTYYPVSYTVTPKNRTAAVVGNPVAESVMSNHATVQVLRGTQISLGGSTVSYNKYLDYDSVLGTYTLSLQLQASSTGMYKAVVENETALLVPEDYNETFVHSGENAYFSNEYTVPYSGWYLIQTWGGTGGAGGSHGGTGGAGASGGYVYGYLWLEAGDTLSIDVGKNGTEGTASPRDEQTTSTGGGFGRIALKKKDAASSETLAIAGGGGGGGNGGKGALGWSDKDGSSAVAVTDVSTVLGEDSAYEGAPGGEATYTEYLIGYSCDSGGTAGASGSNYRASTLSLIPSGDDQWAEELSNEAKETIQGALTDNPGSSAAVTITCLQIDPVEKTVYDPAYLDYDKLIASLQDYTLTTDISKYFDVTGVTIKNGAEAETVLPYTLSNQTITFENIDPTVVHDEMVFDGSVQTFTGAVDFTVNITMEPKAGFLGGNDVPLLIYGEAGYSGGSTGMTLKHGASEAAIPKQTETDFVNVKIPEDCVIGSITLYPGYAGEAPEIVRGESVGRTDFYDYEFNEPTGADAWKSDFVNFTTYLTYRDIAGTVPDGNLAPTETTWYLVNLALEPISAPIKAVFGTEAVAQTEVTAAVIYVKPVVEFQLTNATVELHDGTTPDVNNIVSLDPGVHLQATLIAEDGYYLPADITVTRTVANGTETVLTDYTYNSGTGVLFIDASIIGSDHITVYADAIEVEKFTITYYYAQNPADQEGTQKEVEFEAGMILTSSNIDLPVAGVDYEDHGGYTFSWQWNPEYTSGMCITQNMMAIGTYAPKTFTLTIKYLYGETELGSARMDVLYGTDYSVTAPNLTKDGVSYAPDVSLTTGTMDTVGGETIEIQYHPTSGSLTIYYVYESGDEAVTTVKETIVLGQTYEYTSPTITGYTPDQDVINFTADDVALESGLVYTVTYIANEYEISFDADGDGESDDDSSVFVVKYGTEYNDNLWPVPAKTGYTFAGWFLPDGTTQIKGGDTVAITENTVLTAHWTAKNKITLAILYLFGDGPNKGNTAYETFSKEYTLDEDDLNYSVESPEVEGYTPDQEVVSGTLVNQNVTITVYYYKNTRTLTVEYRYSDTGALIPIELLGSNVTANPYTVELKTNEGTHTTLQTADITGYTTPAVQTYTMGSEDYTLTIWYVKSTGEDIVSVVIEWGELVFTYSQGTWVPETHTYDGTQITPEKPQYNTLTVTNTAESNIAVTVVVSYEANPDEPAWSGLTGYYTTGSTSTGIPLGDRITEWILPVDSSKTVYFWLEGQLTDIPNGSFSGICVVTIKK